MDPSRPPLFVATWSIAPDAGGEGIYRFQADSWPADETERESAAAWLLPYPELPEGAPLHRRLRDHGLPDDPQPPPAAEALPGLLEPLAGRIVVTARDGPALRLLFLRHVAEAPPPAVVDLESLGLFLHPTRGGRGFGDLWRRHRGSPPPRDPGTGDLRALLAALVQAHLRRPPALRQLVARALDEMRSLGSAEEGALEWLEATWRLLDRPAAWMAGTQAELQDTEAQDGQLEEDLAEAPLAPERLLREVVPRFTAEYREAFAASPVLETRGADSGQLPLPEEDQQLLARAFDLLPRHFAGEDEAPGPERPGQRALGAAVARAFDDGAFLLGDAPTGTGKTLAYLLPLLLWSRRHETRVAVSTYTRALQEQAFFREVPRALEILRQAGLPAERVPRVALLKGRANYICGRAIRDTAPEPGSGSLLARATWMRLALHYCEDPLGDLDGFPLDPGLPLGSRPRTARQAGAVVAKVRALPGCCERRAMLRCAAGVRALRADRAHLVVTNHAYVLARPDVFPNLLFDECDHLHEVTVSARSYDIPLAEVTALALELLRRRGHDPAPLPRLQALLRRLPPGDLGERLEEAAEEAVAGARALDAGAHAVAMALRGWQRFRRKAGDGLTREERAFLLHDWLRDGRGDALLSALRDLRDAVDRSDSALRTAIEELGDLPQPAAGRLRWALRRPLERLAHWREGLHIWLGGEEGSADFSEDLHFTVEFENHALPFLSLKWLLPHEWLGRHYYPTLRSAVLVSATTRLKGGFKAMQGYLGLDILAEGGADREGREVATFAGPPTFDPAQALVCVPQDAPPYAPRGPAHQDWCRYVEDVLLFLAERTGGRILGLFTNRMVLREVAERLAAPMAARGMALFWQNMPGLAKEEIMERFRSRVDSVLLGLDTFWYGVDFPGETLQYLVVTKLPFGVLDDYHFAQRARMGAGPHRSRIYLPKALAMFRQGCGRLLRSEADRGAILVLDRRVLEPRHGGFLQELPGGPEEFSEPNLLVAGSDDCLQRAFHHMRLGAEIQRRGLDEAFSQWRRAHHAAEAAGEPPL